jgi:hypothetical protein
MFSKRLQPHTQRHRHITQDMSPQPEISVACSQLPAADVSWSQFNPFHAPFKTRPAYVHCPVYYVHMRDSRHLPLRFKVLMPFSSAVSSVRTLPWRPGCHHPNNICCTLQCTKIQRPLAEQQRNRCSIPCGSKDVLHPNDRTASVFYTASYWTGSGSSSGLEQTEREANS